MTQEVDKKYLIVTEKRLRNYNNLKSVVKKLEEQLKSVEDDIVTLPAITYDKLNVQTSVSGSPTEDSAVDLIEEREKLKRMLKFNKRKLDELEIGLNNLDEIHRRVIDIYVIGGADWAARCDILKYSERQLRKKKNEAIKSIACVIFGYEIFDGYEKSLLNNK